MNKFLLLAALGVAGFSQSIPNAVPMPTPEIQYLDVNGAPLAGAYLCSYAAGTTTPLATYTDSTAGSPNTNPIVLDSVGRASVWVGPSLYKFVLRTGGTGNSCSTGSVVWTQDNVADTTLYFVNYVKTVGTSSLITYTAPQTGGASRTQFSKNTDVLSVKDFGATGDGSTDDTAAINLAMAQSIIGNGSSVPGVCIYFPDGIYRVTAALSYNHTVCMDGNQWRLKYTGASTITAVLTLVGDPTNTYGSHASWLEGSFVAGAIIDGQGHATNGFTLQGVVSAQINYMRVTNVTGAGINCNWCQQTTFERPQVSTDYETFTTVPTNGIIIDNISAANIINQANIDHVSGTGIVLKYALNTLIHGGTSEGNGGFGVLCQGASTPTLYECFNNVTIQLDTEVNTLGDYSFDDVGGGGHVFDNSVFESNSFSVPGYTFTGGAHSNVVIGGSIGCGSTAGAQTINNYIRGVAANCASGSVWVDNGQNDVGRIYNQSTGAYIEPVNNNNIEMVTAHIGGGYRFDVYTPNSTYAEVSVGGSGASDWIGFTKNSGLVPWFVYPATGGFQFQSLSTFRGSAIPDGSIVNHHWGIGRFNTAPLTTATLHIQDSVATTFIPQNGPGQGGTDLAQFMDYTAPQDTPGTIMSKIDHTGAFTGGVIVQKPGGGVDTYTSLTSRIACSGTTEGAMGSISDGATTTWGAAVAAGGGSNHIGIRCNGSGWTVYAK